MKSKITEREQQQQTKKEISLALSVEEFQT